MLRPILSSPEQFVIGIAVVGDGVFHLERANRLDRLGCLFSSSDAPSLMAEAALDVLEEDLASRQLEALAQFRPVFSGVDLGDVAETEGFSPASTAASWMAAMSSLYDRTDAVEYELLPAQVARGSNELDQPERMVDRLPDLVLDYVSKEQPGLVSYFSSEIRGEHRRRRRNVHAVLIDFAGSKLVANFGTLSVLTYANSIDRLKRRLWDLKIDRDREKAGMTYREHELIVHRPQPDDPSLSEKQHERIDEALGALEQQADQEELRLRPMTSVLSIAQHLVGQEGHVSP